MNRELIFIGSITRTMRARDLTNEGCGYGIIVVDGDTDRAKDILTEHGLKNRRNE